MDPQDLLTLLPSSDDFLQAVVSQRSLNQVNGQIAAKSREKRILELTTRQLDAIPAGDDVKMYKGVGKA